MDGLTVPPLTTAHWHVYRIIERPQSDKQPWWRARELNPRPRRCERRALPTELAPHPGLDAFPLPQRQPSDIAELNLIGAEETGRK